MTVDTQELTEDLVARERAIDTQHSYIVQAPAGSGKTELLIQRYLRLLSLVDEPEEVLAITFTVKAAAEMRLRVSDALKRCERGEYPQEPHLKITADAAANVLERDAARGWNILGNLKRLRIQTMDALNATISRMRPISDARVSGSGIIGDDSDLNRLYRRAAEATLEALGGKDDYADASASLLEHLDNNSSSYVAYLAEMLGTRDQWLPLIGAGLDSGRDTDALRQVLENNIQKVVGDEIARLKRALAPDLRHAVREFGEYAAENLLAAGKTGHPVTMFAAEALSDDSPSFWVATSKLLFTDKGEFRKTVNALSGFPAKDSGQKKAFIDLLASLAADGQSYSPLFAAKDLPPQQYDDAQWKVLLALFRLLPLAVAEFQRLCVAHGITDYVAVAMGASAAVGSAEQPGDLGLLLDNQIRHILVDEMQDTSRSQYGMLEALTGGWYAGDGRTLFCVGDPMQSIYRFRNAEVSQFLKARTQGIGTVQLEPLVLRRNFRSGSQLVDWFNTTFASILPTHDDMALGAVKYSSSIAVEQHFDQGTIGVHPVLGSNSGLEAQVAVATVQDLLAGHPSGDVAILLRNRTRAPELLAALRSAGVAYQAVDIDRLSDLPELIELIALTRALSHFGDRLAWLALLRSPCVGLDWNDLHALVLGSRNDSVVELARDAERVSRLSQAGQVSLARFLQQLEPALATDRSSPLHEKVESVWLRMGGPALCSGVTEVDNVYHYLDALARIEDSNEGVDVATLFEELDKERVASSIDARVKIMTMYKAKGLQFDNVVLYGLGRYPQQDTGAVLEWLEVAGEGRDNSVLMSPVGPKDVLDRDPLHRYIGLLEKRKSRYEDARLLYVACTRAVSSLHLVGHVPLDKSGTSAKAPDSRSLLQLLWPQVKQVYETHLQRYGYDAANDEDTVFVEPVRRCLSNEWRLPDVNEFARQPEESPPSGSPPVSFDWVGDHARIAGTVTHHWLQLAADGRFDLDTAGSETFLQRTRTLLQEMGAAPDAVESVALRVMSAVTSLADDEKGRWIVRGPGHAELALNGLLDGRVESVVIDRVRIDENGEHWIIDYKTSTHEGADVEGFLDAELERYRGQLQKYAAIYAAWSGTKPRCALYYPQLKSFVEMK